jgi:membrane-associated phospholipid phosphatase
MALAHELPAQQNSSPPDPPPPAIHHATDSDFTLTHPNERDFFKHILDDQKDIWTSPMRLQPGDFKWLVPMGGIATGLFVSDPSSSWGIASYHANAYNTASNAGLAAAAGLSGSAYIWGRITNNEHLRETGVLATESMIDVLGLQYATQYSTGRLTPEQSHFQNVFFQGGTSFPSNHAALTWAFASVVAREYPNPVAEIGAYGLATGVSLARAAAEKHFLSDVFIGGLIGYETGKHIYNERHDKSRDELIETAPNPDHIASTYVPLDSWINIAMYRLISRGYIDSAYMGIRPWTRMSCARMVSEIDSVSDGTPNLPPDIAETVKDLRAEFANELSALEGQPVESIQLDSVYTRVMQIAGQPLNDNNLGQTIVNDYGRPYQQGFNNYTGFTARAEDGRFAFYMNGEYQHAPSAPAYPLQARDAIAVANQEPVQPATPFPTVNTFTLLDTYVIMPLLGQDISVGKQSLDWGPTSAGSFAISNNAEPFWMLRINRSEPTWIPGISRVFGPFRYDNFFGGLSGHTQFPASPYMYGQKVSFKPLGFLSIGKIKPFKNAEMGFTRTTVFAGQDHVPLTLGSFWNSFTSFGNVSDQAKNSRNDPGARFSTFDFNWQLGGWATAYVDMLTHDELLPLVTFRRTAFNPGIYLSHFPHLSKLDFRIEGLTTNRQTHSAEGAYFFYYEVLYKNLYLNNDNLIGNWIGRDANGYCAWTTYTINPHASIQLSYRGEKISAQYIVDGTTQNVGSLGAIFRLRKQLEVRSFLQYEKWLVPVLNPTRQTDVAMSFQLTWFPKGIGLHQ